MLPVLREHFGNPSSATHSYGWYAEELVQIAREDIAALINATPEEIAFTSGATESNNLAIRGIIHQELSHDQRERCEIVSCKTEHRSVLDPILELPTHQCDATFIEVNKDGLLPPDSFKKAITSNTTLASIMLANNEIGVIHDIPSLTALFRERSPGVFHCDATQAVGKIPVDVGALGVHLLSLSAHKMYGPKGIGALYVRKDTETSHRLSPLIYGGGHERGLRAGTLNVPGIVGVRCRGTDCAGRDRTGKSTDRVAYGTAI